MAEEENFEIPSPESMDETNDTPSYDSMEMPQTNYNAPNYPPMSSDEIQRMIETVVEEKWKAYSEKFGDIGVWKNQIENDLESIKQEVLRLQKRFDSMQAAVVGKVGEYGKGMKDISAEMKALEKVFEKILDPLTRNIKDLNKITKELKGTSKKTIKK